VSNEIRIVSHSSLFYWWPVWAIGFLMAVITLVDNHLMAVVPNGTQAALVPAGVTAQAELLSKPETLTPLGNREVLIAPGDTSHKAPSMEQPRLHMANNKNLGVFFCTVLLLVIATTNIPLRGLWSALLIVTVIFTIILFAVLGWLAMVMEEFHLLDIRINVGGSLFISTILFALWLATLVLFDQQIYMVFTPGQLRVRLAIGEGETAYDTRGMTIQKQRTDLFRHWILGFGSGDLLVNTSGAQSHHFDLPNVLFLGRKVKAIENMLRSMPVVRSQG
jgi:hypothetical protein